MRSKNTILDFLGFRIVRRRVRVVRRKKRKTKTKEYVLLREKAREIVHTKLQHHNEYYNFTYNKVFIKNTKTRWGSCSSKQNLNFSYKIAKLPEHLQDYIIVHELCHLKEFNHSESFWALVREKIPDYAKLRNELKSFAV